MPRIYNQEESKFFYDLVQAENTVKLVVKNAAGQLMTNGTILTIHDGAIELEPFSPALATQLNLPMDTSREFLSIAHNC